MCQLLHPNDLDERMEGVVVQGLGLGLWVFLNPNPKPFGCDCWDAVWRYMCTSHGNWAIPADEVEGG